MRVNVRQLKSTPRSYEGKKGTRLLDDARSPQIGEIRPDESRRTLADEAERARWRRELFSSTGGSSAPAANDHLHSRRSDSPSAKTKLRTAPRAASKQLSSPSEVERASEDFLAGEVRTFGRQRSFLDKRIRSYSHPFQFQRKLLGWFAKHKRPLPWRLNGNPYRIFVVEVMLQQTQIKTVIPYYERWLKAFPNVKTLARAPLDQVLKLWEGLGYYSRARNLHKAAQTIVEKFGGKIPSDLESLQSLPGIGRYTAGAIASIAFQKPVPLVDGNVARVLSRVFNSKKDIAKPETQKILYGLAEMLVSKKHPGDFNQALMELGSLVCIPEVPKCSICPVQTLCLAYKEGDPTKLPIKSNSLRVKEIDMVVGMLTKNGKILIRRRPERGIWGGLWEIPGTVRAASQTPEEALKEEFKETLGLAINIYKKENPVKHLFTHRKALIHPFYCEVVGNGSLKSKRTNTRWATEKDLKKLSFPVPHQKILAQSNGIC